MKLSVKSWLPLLVAVVLAVTACSVSLFIGKDAFAGCFSALAVTGIAGAASFVLAKYTAYIRPHLSEVSVLAASVVRLLLVVFGIAFIIVFTNICTVWFIIWVGLFYMVILSLETCLFIQSRNRSHEING